MRTRFFLGAAAILGALGAAGEASAQTETAIPETCSGIRNAARNTENVPRLENLRRAADRLDCDDDITALINGRLDALKSDSPQADASTDSSATGLATHSTTSTSQQASETGARQRPTAPRVPMPLAIGQNASGRLTASTPVDAQTNVPFDLWTFNAQNGQELRISMTSPTGELDTYLVVERAGEDGQTQEIAINDDRGDGTLNSLVCFTPRASGEYIIRARSFWREQYGEYDLLAQPAATGRQSAAAHPLTMGEEQVGRLNCDSPVDETAYDLWSFQAEAGQVFQISMNSEELDPLISVGQMRDGRFVEVAMDDDGGDGLNSLLRFVPNQSGEYLIRARTYAPEQYGSYQLLTQSSSLISLSQQPVARRQNAWVVSGDIASEGATSYVDYNFAPRRGRSYTFRAIANDFAPIIDIGVLDDDGHITPINFYDGASGRATWSADLPADRPNGRYVVRVSAPTGAAGHFELVINQAP